MGLLGGGLGTVIAAASLLAVTGGGAVAADVSFGEPSVLCTIDDERLSGLSGMVDTPQGLMMVTDNRSQIFRLTNRCRVRVERTLPDSIETIDVEELAATADGTLWIADIGGNRTPRSDVKLLRWIPGESSPTEYTLRYPEGTRDAEALLLDMRESPILVTKESDGDSAVFTPRGRVAPGRSGELVQAGTLPVSSWPGADPAAPGSLLVTGGAVAPSGVHAVVRTYTNAYEWDVPDGDVASAILSRPPDRHLRLPPAKQGESISYSEDGRSLILGSEQTPSNVDLIPIQRAVTETGDENAVGIREIAALAFIVVVMGIAIIWLAVWRARRNAVR